jgi:hypothetical protein
VFGTLKALAADEAKHETGRKASSEKANRIRRERRPLQSYAFIATNSLNAV